MNLFGGNSSPQAAAPTRYIGIPVQTSIKGSSIPYGWGTFKCGCNLIDYLNFQSVAVTSTQSGGKGGGGSQTTTSYNYFADIMLGIVEGPVAGIRTVWRDQEILTLATSGLSLATGAIGQAPWGHLTSPHNLGYSGLAYVYAAKYALNSSATLPNHSFEVQSTIRQVIGGVTQDDANPGAILTDFFSVLPQWNSAWTGSYTDYSNYCLAAGLLLSPVLESQRQTSDFLTEILAASNSDCIWSDGQLKIIPYGDTTITGNGVTWVPNLTPSYNIPIGQFISEEGDDPIKWDFTRPADAYNYVQIEFLDRTASYNTDIAPALDQANIDQFGLRKQDPFSLHSICSGTVASAIAQLMVQRTCNVRRTAVFTLPEVFGLLDPMDTLTIPLRNGGTRFVRIISYQENPDDATITYTVEEMLVGVGHAPAYTRQVSGAVPQNFNIAPGDAAAPAIFDVPVQLAQVVGLETWIGVSPVAGNAYWGGCEIHVSTDGTNYVLKQTVQGSSRLGVTTLLLPSGADPDTVNSLHVDLSQSLGSLEAGTLADANNGTTLCFVDGEYISYQQCVLTSPYQYNLGKNGATAGLLRRGMWGSPISAHAIGSLFVRLDDAVCKIPYNATDVGRTLYIKLVSFNCYGLALQDISTVTAYTHTIGGPPTIYAPTSLTVTPALKGLQLNWINAANVGIAAVEIWRSATSSFSGASKIADAGSYATSYNDQAVASATPYWYWIRCRDIAGNVGAYDPVSTGAGVSQTGAQVQTVDLGNAVVTAAKIDPAALASLMLAAGIEGVGVGASNPATPAASSVFFNTTDHQLYRWNTSTSSWTLAVPAVNITGQLTDAQIAAVAAAKVTGQLVDSQLAAIAAAKLTGQIVGTQITNGAVSTPQLAAGAVTTAVLAAGAVTTGTLAAGAVTAAKANISDLSANILVASSITAGMVAANAISTAALQAGSVTATIIAGSAVTAGKLDANAVTAGTVAAGAINATAIIVGNIIVTGHLTANSVTYTSAASNSSGDSSVGVTIDANTYAVIVSGTVAANGFSGNYDVQRDGSSLAPYPLTFYYTASTFQILDFPSAGGHTYYCVVPGGGAYGTTIVVTQLKR